MNKIFHILIILSLVIISNSCGDDVIATQEVELKDINMKFYSQIHNINTLEELETVLYFRNDPFSFNDFIESDLLFKYLKLPIPNNFYKDSADLYIQGFGATIHRKVPVSKDTIYLEWIAKDENYEDYNGFFATWNIFHKLEIQILLQERHILLKYYFDRKHYLFDQHLYSNETSLFPYLIKNISFSHSLVGSK